MQAEQMIEGGAADVAMRWHEQRPSHHQVDPCGQQMRRLSRCTGVAMMLQRLQQLTHPSNRERRQKRAVTPMLHSQIDGAKTETQTPRRRRRRTLMMMTLMLPAPECRSIGGCVCVVAPVAVRWRSVAVVANQPHELHSHTAPAAQSRVSTYVQRLRLILSAVPPPLASVDAPLSMSRRRRSAMAHCTGPMDFSGCSESE